MQTMEAIRKGVVGILGFGVEGRSTLRWLQSQGVSQIVIIDQSPQAGAEVQGIPMYSGEHYLDALKDCNVVIRSAGVYPVSPELLRFQMHGGLLTSQVELFFELHASQRVIGVTGTLGKGSCVTMIHHVLQETKRSAVIGGNFGVPVLDLLGTLHPETFVILELSSFQLMTLAASPHIAVVLQTTSEHLNWHRSVEEYRDAKANLVRWQRSQDLCIAYADSEGSAQIATQSPARRLLFGREKSLPAVLAESSLHTPEGVLTMDQCQIVGSHQLQNMAAAYLVCRELGLVGGDILEALKSYPGLEFRLQQVGNARGITFLNDSYATRPEATLGAVQGMKQPFVLILGGSEKHADFTLLAQVLAQTPVIQGIALLGETAERLENVLAAAQCPAPIQKHDDLQAAFQWSVDRLSAGGVLMLSPACASFGLFANYKERGLAFNRLVEQWIQTPES